MKNSIKYLLHVFIEEIMLALANGKGLALQKLVRVLGY